MNRNVWMKMLRLDVPTVGALTAITPEGISESSTMRVLIAWHARFGEKDIQTMATELAADGTYVHLTRSSRS